MKSRAHRYRYVRHVAMSCFPDGRASVAPPTLSYASPQSWTYGAAITTLSPTTTGATSFAVQSGTLPTGVSLNASTGDITGTPTVAKAAANVVIRATGPGGTADATINIAVPSPLYTSLVDYWNLDEASGTRVGSHAALNLTDNNTVTSQATGGPDGGQCAQFTAANSEYLSRASEASLQTGDIDFTFAAWAYFDSDGVSRTLISKGAQASAAAEFSLYRWSDNKVYFDVGSGASLGEAGTAGTVSKNAWHLVVCWHDSVANTVNLQIDDGSVVSVAFAAGGHTNATSFNIGNDSPSTHYMDGRAAFVLMSKRVLTASERTWLWNAGAGRAYSALATYDGG